MRKRAGWRAWRGHRPTSVTWRPELAWTRDPRWRGALAGDFWLWRWRGENDLCLVHYHDCSFGDIVAFYAFSRGFPLIFWVLHMIIFFYHNTKQFTFSCCFSETPKVLPRRADEPKGYLINPSLEKVWKNEVLSKKILLRRPWKLRVFEGLTIATENFEKSMKSAPS